MLTNGTATLPPLGGLHGGGRVAASSQAQSPLLKARIGVPGGPVPDHANTFETKGAAADLLTARPAQQ